MHTSVMIWTAEIVREYELAGRRTLEVGSQDVNGTVRGMFTGTYTGVDMAEGAGVDLVADAHALPFEDGEFETVLCLEMVEHDPAFWLSMVEIGRVLTPDGYLLLTTRGIEFPYHPYPEDYWRFTSAAIRRLFELAGVRVLSLIPDPQTEHPGWLTVGQKTP